MKYQNLHSWEVSPREAIQLQKELKKKISLKKSFNKIKIVAGADVSYYKNNMIAGIVILKFPQLEIIEKKSSLSCKLSLHPRTPYLQRRTKFTGGLKKN